MDHLLADNPDDREREILVLDSNQNGIQQISEALANRQGIDAIHVVSHGSDGFLTLGATELGLHNLDVYAGVIAEWRDALTDNADLLFYGCDLAAGSDGQTFIQRLAGLTGADVAASDDLTGHADLGGDWQLERQTGELESEVVFSAQLQQQWTNTLSMTVYTSFQNRNNEHEIKNNGQVGQEFRYTSGNGSYSVDTIGLQLQKESDAGDQTITVTLRSSWNSSVLATATISSSALNSSFNWYELTLDSTVQLNDGQTYVIRVTSSSSDGKVYAGINADGDYGGGRMILDGPVFKDSEDLLFRVGKSPDTAPPVQAGSNASAAVEGGTDTLTSAELSYSDEQPASAVAYTVTTGPSNGQLELTTNSGVAVSAFTQDDIDNNHLIYVHDSSDTISDSFTFSVTDGQGNSVTGQTFAITITPVNDAPVLDNSGSMSLNPITEDSISNNGSLVSDIIASAGGNQITDVDGDPEGIAVTSINTTNGAWEYSTDGGSNWNSFGNPSTSSAVVLTATANDRIRFAPNANFNDVVSISFRAWDTSDGHASGDTGVDVSVNGNSTAYSATMESAGITVTAVNDAPVLTPKGPLPYSMTEDDTNNSGALISWVLGSSVTDLDSGVVEGIAITGLTPGMGSGEYSTDGGSSWTKIGAVSDTSALLLRATDRIRFVPDGENADSASFTYRAWDQSGSESAGTKVDTSTNGNATAFSTATDTVSITVTAVNDQPTATNLTQTHSYTEGTTSVAFDDIVVSDVDTDEQITATLTLANPSTGVLTTSSGNSEIYSPGTGIWTVTGSVVQVNTALAEIAFTPAVNNDQNTTIAISIQDGLENGATAITGMINLTVTPVTDLTAQDDTFSTDEDTVLTENIATNDSTTSGGMLSYAVNTDVSNGTLALNNDGAFTYTPDTNFNGSDSFTYTVTDASSGESSTQTVALTVNQVDDPGTFGGDTNGTGTEDGGAITGTLTFTDTADGDSNPNFTVTGAANDGSANIDSVTGAWSYTPAANFHGNDNFTITVTDDDGNTQTQVISVTVNPITDLTANDDRFNTDENTVLNANVSTNDSTTSGGTLSYAVDNDVSHGTLVMNDDGSFTYTPAENYTGSDSFIYTVTDTHSGERNTGTVSIVINPVNDHTPVANDAVVSLAEDASNGISVHRVVASDLDEGDTLTYAITAGNDEGVFTIDSNTGEIIVSNNSALDVETTSVYTLTVHVSDGVNSDTATITVHVIHVNHVPTVTSIADLSVNSHESLRYAISSHFFDADEDALTYSATLVDGTPLPNWLHFDTTTGVFSGTPTDTDVGTFYIEVTVRDGRGAVVTDQFSVTVKPVLSHPGDPLVDPPLWREPPGDPNDQVRPPLAIVLPPDTDRPAPFWVDDILTPPTRLIGTPPVVTQPLPSDHEDDNNDDDLLVIPEVTIEAIDTPRPPVPDIPEPDEGIDTHTHTPVAAPTQAASTPPEEPAVLDERLLQALDSLREDMDNAARSQILVINSVKGITVVMLAGFVYWYLQTGKLLASILATTPLWRRLDPLAVLNLSAKERQKRLVALQEAETAEEQEHEALKQLLNAAKTDNNHVTDSHYAHDPRSTD